MLIFDCDGVLIDSEVLICRIVAESLTKIGFPMTTEMVIQRFAGRPGPAMRREIEHEWGRTLPSGFSETVHSASMAAYHRELKIMPGILEALARIKTPVCVASSSEPDKLRLGLSLVGLEATFDPNILSASMVRHGKPAPDLFIFAAGWLRTPPAQCLVIEDSVAGTTAAVQAGIPVVGFTGGSHCPVGHDKRLREAGACEVIAYMRELPDVVGRHLGPQA